ncbi:hypothetical protein CONCODRAFT_3675 [Conidiobolus coronatus NRRL 28638]|uniref:Uncharacterized protein n=1 Tax=Conidiobolus coronatus (strain ATCC 28846 / CBS 209.66 / NRRL 28638) TaxID=796925 RepID=A0A137PEP2_CONC2|nr:hypothetical protein CONCODRAFT_3675 [Conidiobolus coronatus NRRL 28638]|eukprot:KXN73435.1 hypothetical protein CONCODRAFT_3675 [Conidiobolus coronatus NRRL 28638]
MSSRINTIHFFFAILAITLCFFIVPTVAQSSGQTPSNPSDSSSFASQAMSAAMTLFSKGFNYLKENSGEIWEFMKNVGQKTMAAFNKPAVSGGVLIVKTLNYHSTPAHNSRKL